MPQYLYSEQDLQADFNSVAQAAEVVFSARGVLSRAEKEQSEASVDDLWD